MLDVAIQTSFVIWIQWKELTQKICESFMTSILLSQTL